MKDENKTKKQLINELVEIRKQNIELKKLETKYKLMEESLIKERTFIEGALNTMNDIIAVFDLKGKFLKWNKAMNKVTGYSDDEINSMKPTDFFLEDDTQKVEEAIKTVVWYGYTRLEVSGVTKDGRHIPYEIYGTLLKDQDGNPVGIFVVARDITERKQAEEALLRAHEELETLVKERTVELTKTNEALQAEIMYHEQTEEALREINTQLNTLIEAIPDPVYFRDAQRRYLLVNKAVEEIVGLQKEEIIGKTYEQLLPQDLIEQCRRSDEEAFKRKLIRTEERMTDENGKNIFFETIKIPLLDDQGNIRGLVGISRNITERKQAEEKILSYQEQLRSLASELSLIEERERRKIATSLHDNISQTLALSYVKLGALQELASSSSLAKSFKEICELIEQAILYTKTLTSEISPPILYELGFEAAVEWLGEQIQKQYGILFNFEDDKQPKPLNNEIRVILFQAVRELFINITKHAQACNAKVFVWREGNEIQISVEDDGVGFDISKINSHSGRTDGFGLFNIRERLNYIGGRLKIKSEIGYGTRVTLVAPLKSEEKTAMDEMI